MESIEGNKKKGSIKKRIIRAAATTLVAGAGFLGADQGVQSVEAASGAPTATPTRTWTPTATETKIVTVAATGTTTATATPTPDDLDKKIVAADATITALSKEKVLAQRGVTQTAIAGEIEDIKNPKTATLTATVTPTTTPTVTPTFTNEQIDIKKRAGIWPSSTSTSTPAITATFVPAGDEPKGSSGNQGSVIPDIGGAIDNIKEKGVPSPVKEIGSILGSLGAITGLAKIADSLFNRGRIWRGIKRRLHRGPYFF